MSITQPKPHVVIVDDDSNVLRSLRLVLKGRYDVTTFTSAEEAVQAMRKAPPDAVVLDIRMPIHDGLWGYREIRKFLPSVPIIFNSAYQDALPQDDINAFHDVFAHVAKGGDLSAFLKIVAAACAQARARQR